ncbi:MAG TPA: ABC transporter ATP-binding protein, partial [Bacteroidales bacterium]|nr:ABC transporter ATP-binding protein [Bacteroidales bacterium]
QHLIVDFKSESGVVRAVKDVSFSLEKAKTIGIVGESGSGKSVTSLALMGLLPAGISKVASGTAMFADKSGNVIDILALPENKLRKFRGAEIAMIFQEPMTSLNPVYKCGRQVAETIMLHQKVNKREAKRITLDWFREVMLPDPEKAYRSYPHELSGGQRQRVMIAIAMSCRPSLLIADEPTTALDVTVQKNILELMKHLQQKYQMSIIFISHDLGVIAEIADYVLVMYKGEVVEQGSVEEIFKNPQHPYTKGLLACRPRLDARYKRLPTVDNFMENKTDGLFEEITTGEYQQELDAIYKNEPMLEAGHIKTYFTFKHGLFRAATKFKAVDDVSFTVFPGETLGIVGESGCGKTTLGRTVLRLVEPTSGKIVFFGNDITSYSKSKLRHIRKDFQIIFQDPYSSLNPRLTVGKAITEGMRIHKVGKSAQERKAIAIGILKKVNLSENIYERYPHELSGGQRQRICIARALALRPKFIICDESVSALDVSVQAQVLNLLNQLKKEYRFSLIFISHDLSVVKYMSDRMMVMKNGKLVEYGPSEEIYKNPQTDYTKNLIAAIPKGL